MTTTDLGDQPNTITTGQRLRSWRTARAVTQLELARRASLEQSKLCRIELGRREPRIDDLQRLVEALGLTMAEFYGELPAVAPSTDHASEPAA